MSIRLGVDLGTTFTAAAVADDGAVDVVRLESDTATMPSVVAFDGDSVLVGVEAERRIADSPTSGAREFKRRLGDTTPYVLDGAPHGAEELTGHVLRAVVDRAGVTPDEVQVAHPANWGEYKLELLRDAGRLAGLGDIELIAEPAAAALHYAGSGKVAAGAVVAVYDFGGGTFDTAVVRVGDSGAEVLGRPEGLERLGGVDIDQVVLAHVDATLDGALSGLDTSDLETRRAISALRRACTEAKEALSADTDVSIPVRLPSLQTEVRMTRAELEAALDARLDDTLAALDRAVSSAGVSHAELAGVLLVGGSSRIPAVAERVATHTGRPVLADAEHSTVVAAGAATPGAALAASEPVAAAAATAGAAAPSREKGGRDAKAGGAGAAARRRPSLGTVGRAAAAVGALGGGGVGGYAAWRYFRDGDDEQVVQDVVELTSDVAEPDHVTTVADRVEDLARTSGEATATEATPPTDEGVGPAEGEPMDLSFLKDFFSPTPQGRVTSAVFEAAVARPVAPPPRPQPAPAAPQATAPVAPTAPQAPAPAPPPPPTSTIVSDPQVEDVRAQLRERLESLAVPEGADPQDVEKLHRDLDGLLDRFQPYPGQSADDAIAALKYEFEDRVRDFAQDQRIDAVIEEQRRQLEEAQEVESELSEFRGRLQERLDAWSPPEGADPEEVAELRETLAAMIDRAAAIPGQSAEDAIAELRLRFNDQVGDFAQDLKIDALVEEEREQGAVEEEEPVEEEAPEEPVGETPAEEDGPAEEPAEEEAPEESTDEAPTEAPEESTDEAPTEAPEESTDEAPTEAPEESTEEPTDEAPTEAPEEPTDEAAPEEPVVTTLAVGEEGEEVVEPPAPEEPEREVPDVVPIVEAEEAPAATREVPQSIGLVDEMDVVMEEAGLPEGVESKAIPLDEAEPEDVRLVRPDPRLPEREELGDDVRMTTIPEDDLLGVEELEVESPVASRIVEEPVLTAPVEEVTALDPDLEAVTQDLVLEPEEVLTAPIPGAEGTDDAAGPDVEIAEIEFEPGTGVAIDEEDLLGVDDSLDAMDDMD